MPYNMYHPGAPKTAVVIVSSLLSIIIPIQVLAIIVFVFIFVDFVVGLIVSYRVRKQGFVTERAWQTIWKLIGAEICVLLAYLLDNYVVTMVPLYLANIFAGIICGVDLWSILTNFAMLSNHPAFRLIKKWGKSEIENKIGGLADFDKELENNK